MTSNITRTIGLFALLGSSTAFATPSRVSALSSNAGITDDTDFMSYPTEASEKGDNAWFHYDGEYTGAVLWDGNAVVMGLGPSGGWDMSWVNSHGESAYGVSAAYLPDERDAVFIGGGWGTADRSDGLENLSIGGGLELAGLIDDAATAIDFSAGVSSRSIQDSEFSSWGAGLGYASDGDASNLNLAGQYYMGPRFGGDDSLAVLSIGTMGMIDAGLGDEGAVHTYLALPATNLAGEYVFNDWLILRASVITAVMIHHDGEEFSSSAMVDGAAGMGIETENGGIDLTFSPDWALSGPHFLTGNSSDMVGMITAYFAL